MNKIPLWKRVGGWLRRSHEPIGQANVIHVDAEGLLVDPEGQNQPEPTALAAQRSSPTDPQLATLEEGFNRLVDVLESINENVVNQREQNSRIHQRLEDLAGSLQNTAELGRLPEAFEALSEQLRQQAIHQQQLSETIGRLPELTETQLERLGDIHQQLETAGESDSRLTETFAQVHQSLQGMESHSSLQTACLRNLESASARHQQQLQELVHQQNRRLIWAAGLLGGLFLVAAILIAVATYLGRLN